MSDDSELLRRFVEAGSQEAFAELLRGRVNLVYSAALRQVGGDHGAAEDVTQKVFLALARRAPDLLERPVLVGWLYTATRMLSAKAVRAHRRWRQREKEAHAMTTSLPESAASVDWAPIQPILDQAMHELDESDREAILLRFFDGEPFARIGAQLGVAENAARMRVERALERLHARLVKRGITSTAVALGLLLAQQGVIAAPADLVATATANSLGQAKTVGRAWTRKTRLVTGTVLGTLAIAGVWMARPRRLLAAASGAGGSVSQAVPPVQAVPSAPQDNATAVSSITGVVVNERNEPVSGVTVEAFSTDAAIRQVQWQAAEKRGNGSASTDGQGRFQISRLPLGTYLIAADPMFPRGSQAPAQLYGTTFYPSTLSDQMAGVVSVVAESATTIRIELVPVRGVRVSGSVVGVPSGNPTAGLSVKLFHQFGGFGGDVNVAVVGAQGTFEIPRVPPGRYRLTIGGRLPARPSAAGTEFADKLIDVQDSDLDGLSFVLSPGASISGRILVEPGMSLSDPGGMRISAEATPGQYAPLGLYDATATTDWTFQMAGVRPGSYQFSVHPDLASVAVTRVLVDGVPAPGGAVTELTNSGHNVIVFVTPRTVSPPASTPALATLSPTALVEQFRNERSFGPQFVIAQEIAARRDASVLPLLADLLGQEDRHLRGNTAFLFGSLGDPRGLRVITAILTDRSDRPRGQGARVGDDGRYRVALQIAADRYYAVHLLGELRDPTAIPTLIPLLQDSETNASVPWALDQIGDRRAVAPLIAALDVDDPSMRVLIIYSLEKLHATEALPRLNALLNDERKANFGASVSVADAARGAIAALQ